MKKQIDKEKIESLKKDSNAFLSFLQSQNDGTICYVLGKLGRLSNGSSKQPLLNLLHNENANIRILAIQNLAKFGDISLLETFFSCARDDSSTDVRRESVSAIGRLRNELAIPELIELLSDNDPKVVLQAIRGLLVFSKNSRVENQLLSLLEHPNELIRELVAEKFHNSSHKPKCGTKHDEFPVFLGNTVVESDVIEALEHVPDESIHLTFTSPPYYNARDYAIYQSYDEYLQFLEGVFREVHRITHEGRFFVLNTSPVIVPRISRSHASKRYAIPYDIHPLLVKMGWEFIDDIVWIKPEASVKNRNAGFYQHRKPLGYKPNPVTELLMVYRKKTDRLIDWSMRQYASDKIDRSKVLGDYETSNIWRIDPTFDKVHSAVFPLKLCCRVIEFYSFVEDLVFDPFAGSGTLGNAAIRLNRSFFLTEKESKFVDRMKENLHDTGGLFKSENVQFTELSSPRFVNLEQFKKMADQFVSIQHK